VPSERTDTFMKKVGKPPVLVLLHRLNTGRTGIEKVQRGNHLSY